MKEQNSQEFRVQQFSISKTNRFCSTPFSFTRLTWFVFLITDSFSALFSFLAANAFAKTLKEAAIQANELSSTESSSPSSSSMSSPSSSSSSNNTHEDHDESSELQQVQEVIVQDSEKDEYLRSRSVSVSVVH
jgi:hypothetical protein